MELINPDDLHIELGYIEMSFIINRKLMDYRYELTESRFIVLFDISCFFSVQ